MLQSLINIDKSIFSFFNSTISNPIFDVFFPIITNQDIWTIPILIGVIILSIKGGKRGKISSAILVIAIILADYSSAQILKPFFQRLRPSHELIDGIRLLVPKGGKYGFVSSHAANIFAAATVLSYFYIKYKKLFFTIAVLVAFSRVYVGVHYPADIFFGSLLGYGLAWIVLTAWVMIKMRNLKAGKNWVEY
ncbi:MAG: phosphatase PAP2 family protein [Candidatus Neomarinimicrobiota bacterium]|jgi:undecaprenyl-diphosphatase|nr:phosphatase PAP2 family protein [Candidatus Neomarinimicrobiota bacterium]MEC7901410.1 phosphatase PAP2 family protein [Candidatus Neomarinimicrobiota bacterium]MED5247813.1 phosphatase PAP2 family protein [Candidatus Neomarinimicrobiota bacterium]|tara:strand:- start:2419 stop:2994 length:576 start_codon:yes stop_codon:yes gene_type:complete